MTSWAWAVMQWSSHVYLRLITVNSLKQMTMCCPELCLTHFSKLVDRNQWLLASFKLLFLLILKLYHQNKVTNWNWKTILPLLSLWARQLSRLKLLLDDYLENNSNTFHLIDCFWLSSDKSLWSPELHMINKISGFIDLWVLSLWMLQRKQTVMLLSLKWNLEWEMSHHLRNNSP